MGWEWKDEEGETNSHLGFRGVGDLDDARSPRSDEDRCSTRRIVKSQCKTEEVEPGKFIRKCEKTEQILKDCVGRPTEVVKSTTEYTEDDVTNDLGRGAFALDSSVGEPFNFNFPGLRSDIEAIERSMFGGLSRFFEGAEEMKNGFFQVFGTPRIFEDDSSSSSRRGIPIEGQLEKGTSREQRKDDSVYSDFAGQVRDV
ncbi:hypothetical protein BVC80_1289g123 [Macleaya cordata]|uniref:Mal d 1-associated protein n=1 Tax=Macleaya cordata TaxID=56857 RepID=A0A200Q9N4_MACCD|nr:hypothetical protein BVC80_1289g123 [Macleaya cordata]